MISVIDAHCHYDDERFDEDVSDAVQRMLDAGVIACVDAGSDIETSKKALRLAEDFPCIYAACGIHPHEAERAGEDDFAALYVLLSHEKAVALGEIGLDYYYDADFKEAQKRVLQRQLDMAVELDKPAVFHIRDAHGDMVDLFRSQSRLPSGVIHSFSGSAETALEYVRMGFHISFSGPLTFKNAHNLRRACACVPLDRLLVETDSPYMAPVPFRGQRNEPANVIKVLEQMAEIHSLPVEEMARITLKNTKTVYRI